mgnify:CR=1 FL=1
MYCVKKCVVHNVEKPAEYFRTISESVENYRAGAAAVARAGYNAIIYAVCRPKAVSFKIRLRAANIIFLK